MEQEPVAKFCAQIGCLASILLAVLARREPNEPKPVQQSEGFRGKSIDWTIGPSKMINIRSSLNECKLQVPTTNQRWGDGNQSWGSDVADQLRLSSKPMRRVVQAFFHVDS